jgi:methylglutaconyl-CoA hydratase
MLFRDVAQSTMVHNMVTDGPTLIRTDVGNGVATLTLDSPANRNALSTPLLDQLATALRVAVADPAVRVIVLSHTGPVFSSGADLRETAAAFETGRLPVQALGDLLAAIWECPKPVVARIAGAARAGGIGLIAAADIAVCAEDATFAFTEVRLGVVPAVISATVLRRLHPRAAAELYLTGDTFDGRRAVEVGLVTAATPEPALDTTVAAYCAALVRGGPEAMAGTKELLRRQPGATVREDAAELGALSARYFRSAEGREGVLARRERRDPAWVPHG